jgi:hypothetical protein
MTYITHKDTDALIALYEKNKNVKASVLGKLFAEVNESIFYQEMEAWAKFIDNIIPDWFPLNYIQSGLISIVQFVYDDQAYTHIGEGVYQGNRVGKGIDDTISWAQNQISSAVNDMRNKIDTEIVDPVRQKAAQIEQSLKDAQTKLSNMGVSIDGFQNDVNTMKSNISSFDGSIKAFDGKLGSFDSKLKGLDSTATGLQSQLRDAQAKLNEYKSIIDNLKSRVEKLEGKPVVGILPSIFKI